ncbi:MAG: hypothetical protein C0519_11515 [Hyphomicrobium sp.]|jgi:hypothetical protein|nr:hypothetical protein [Hyphomicrobium sp.]PPD07197.1 MAG: hypothetical protein CTY28_10480 [Hyphomicrobium sp.]
MESLGALMMVLALTWPIAGGAITGLILGLIRGHGLVGTLLNALAGGLIGFALVMAAMLIPGLGELPQALVLAITLGLPIIGGFLGVALKSRFA